MIILNSNSYGELDLLADNKSSLYSYKNLSEFHQNEVEKILNSKKPNRVWEYLKGFEFTKTEIIVNRNL